ncbi:DUF4013 domain-containing protein [Haloferula sp. BvORR071]|uniref:DUF4013 domain-containing protein n=1 Tax=Haloferula sp. BvORR071 TaxID=1396141 RepID=UPI00055575CD|nr:DUF4013 domain-containing protein [Haloferula sp. BvORR071]
MPAAGPINLSTPLGLRTAFRFPLQSKLSQAEVLQGSAWLLVPFIGWLLNMGHRIAMTHRMQHGLEAWPAWTNYRTLLKHGAITFLGMLEYHLPALVCEALAWHFGSVWLHVLAAVLWIVATIAVPGYITHYCFTLDPREVFDPFRAMRRVFQGGRAYWKAWGIALAALACSFLGLLVGGFGFLVSSVWFWQVAGFSFATVFSEKFGLRREMAEDSR